MINPRLGLSMAIAALMAAAGGGPDGRTRSPTPRRPVANLDPARATRYRGPIAIHAARTVDTAGAPDLLCQHVLGQYWPKTVPVGVVVAIGNLTACDPSEQVADHLTPTDRASGNFTRGRFAWRIDNVRRLTTPIPLIGRQGLFNWTPDETVDHLLGPPLDHGAACRRHGWAA